MKTIRYCTNEKLYFIYFKTPELELLLYGGRGALLYYILKSKTFFLFCGFLCDFILLMYEFLIFIYEVFKKKTLIP